MLATLRGTSPVAIELFWRRGGWLRTGALALGASALLAASAKVQVPFWPVPMTMQSLTVIVIGIAFGSRLGVAAVLTYLFEGLIGLPVFAGATAGPAYFAGPTAGYLAGFVLCAAVVGWLAERGWDRTLGGATLAMTIGHVLLLASGVLWLAVLFGMSKAIAVGLTPFIAATVVKTALGSGIVAAFWSSLGSRRSTRQS